MRFILQALLLVGFFSLAGCAHRSELTSAHPAEKQLNVPFIQQDDAYCGPSALAMVLAQQNKSVNVAELAKEMLLPARGGSLQIELKASVRRQGYLAYEITPTMDALLTEIEAGRLVCPFEQVLESKNAFYLVCQENQAEQGKIAAFRDWMLALVEQEELQRRNRLLAHG